MATNRLPNRMVLSSGIRGAYVEIYDRGDKEKRETSDLNPERTIPAERPPLVGEVSANFCG
jgi:hypothetical protein